tara:strand:+ start:265 stop:564 length:300 start_codon:yes stop_codon:yes gene_type:complete
VLKLVATLLFCCLALPVAAHEFHFCEDSQTVRDTLEGKWKESVAGMGLSDHTKGVVEVFVSSIGSYTLVMVYPDGRTCVIDSGMFWEYWRKDTVVEESP